ncbi:geranylgeranyl reductase [Candidatus Koribacter versatilis Ellin345]|uniref:Geranylgeranyl reductase n=1 Tax=Koribacter versatilis (strain Ellin345) TaxID=204669 RepID=Q1IMS5_KORVE|nr:geranylgeranyl reductase family protein [Candidatus Koribacter versatilis]ABF41825.1 geranylgeranyl reductase [Candidatus Koribacter versatilis Ellin345]
MGHQSFIIVGAGPSGTAAAYDLAKAGHSVLLLDRSEFPRVKPCGGGLTVKTLKALRYSVTPVVRIVAKGLQVTNNLAEPIELRGKHPICFMTVRAEFDDFCLRQTLEAGARFQKISEITGVEEFPDHVVLRTRDGEFHAEYLLGADGANSKVRLLLGAQPWFRRAIAVEAHAPVHKNAKAMEIDFGVVPRGYAWSFHKGDHLNVGLCTESAEVVKLSRDLLANYLKRKFGSDEYSHFVGHYLGIGGMRYEPKHKRIFLVGDAAGMTDPLSGEGIYNAIKSGQAAASALLQNSEAPHVSYAQALADVRDDLEFCERAIGKFYGHLNAGFAMLKVPGMKKSILKGYAMGLTLSEIRGSIHKLPFASVDDTHTAEYSNHAEA